MPGHPLKPHEIRKVGGLPVYVYNILCTRIKKGTAICYLKYAPAYKQLAHMLDSYGMVSAKVSNVYVGRLNALKTEIDNAEVGNIGLLMYARLGDHLRKNMHRRRVEVAGSTCISGVPDDRCLSRFGFTISEFVSHYESLFTDGMNWDRVVSGDIQMDHTIPVRIFDLSTVAGVHAAYALSNTRPMWRGDNARKGKTSDLDWISLFGEGAIRG